MLGTYFYHEILRKTVIAFGTLFNNIQIHHKDVNGVDFSVMKVPLAYGPIQKFLARIEQQPTLNTKIALTLPRLSFEMTGLQYDPSRKTSIVQTFIAVDNNDKVKKVYMPVPYNVSFELNIMTKLNDDSLQIIEQILPFFQPSFNVTVNLISSIGEKKDIPIVLESIQQNDKYEGSFLDERRLIVHTLRFTAKTYLFGPVADSTDGLIKRVDVDYYDSTNIQTARRVQRYTATPQAVKDYNNDNTTTVDGDISTSVTKIKLNSTASISADDRIIINDEIMYVRSIEGNFATVYRGYDDTIVATHTHGTSVDKLTPADDALIEPGDDFGFNETVSFFTDGKRYSEVQGFDV
jgi:hypothetical protein